MTSSVSASECDFLIFMECKSKHTVITCSVVYLVLTWIQHCVQNFCVKGLIFSSDSILIWSPVISGHSSHNPFLKRSLY